MKKDDFVYTVAARMTPQTSVNKKPYNVVVSVNEKDFGISSASCDCQASAGSPIF